MGGVGTSSGSRFFSGLFATAVQESNRPCSPSDLIRNCEFPLSSAAPHMRFCHRIAVVLDMLVHHHSPRIKLLLETHIPHPPQSSVRPAAQLPSRLLASLTPSSALA